MDRQQQGQCMCGSIQFVFKGEPKFISECVCHSCRQAHGATAVCWVGVNDNQFQISEGEELLKWHQSSEASARGFCTSCGTKILYKSSKWPGEIHMTRTCFADDVSFAAKVLVFADEFPHWTLLIHKK